MFVIVFKSNYVSSLLPQHKRMNITVLASLTTAVDLALSLASRVILFVASAPIKLQGEAGRK